MTSGDLKEIFIILRCVDIWGVQVFDWISDSYIYDEISAVGHYKSLRRYTSQLWTFANQAYNQIQDYNLDVMEVLTLYTLQK